ncbi:hypothetical protein Rhopal_001693-T1 [Rhodotorula paludigena]|uniref:SAP domain-containing protein n=1 Tax=Rhodotorula paludigena TaxID=86838 RepID=A0AAV5GHA4_9BASI|nr:hypothetical protein Rhopal_001693-T1 [Rhodotorula paludigena]
MSRAPTVSELRAALAALSLDSRGTKDTLKRRLAKHRSRSSASPPSPAPPTQPRTRPGGQCYDSFLVFDVEATCEHIAEPWGKLAFAYPNEIIEWPVILLQWQKREQGEAEGGEQWDLVQVDEYHSYVRPVWAPKLSNFCMELTGITQADVDAAPTFPELCKRFHRDFIKQHALFTSENKTVWVTDGPWDLRDFVAKTCYLSRSKRPDWLAGEIVDLRLLASAFFASLKRADSPGAAAATASENAFAALEDAEVSSEPEAPEPPTPAPLPTSLTATTASEPHSTAPPAAPDADPASPTGYLPSHLLTAPSSLSLPAVLSALTLPPFQGRLHSGLCDARNAARILVDLCSRRGVLVRANRRVPEGGRGAKERRWGWMDKTGGVAWDEFVRRETGRIEEKKKGKGKGTAA